MAWFDLNSLQQQISQSLGEASELINTVNRLEILNLDEMAVQQEEEEKLLEEDDEEDEEDEEEVVINHNKSVDNAPLNKHLFTPIPNPSIKNELPNSAHTNLFDHNMSYDDEVQSSIHGNENKKEQEELARKIQEQLADEWNDSFLNDKPNPSQSIPDQDLLLEDTKSVHSSVAESALTTTEDHKSSSETTQNLPNNIELAANSPLPSASSMSKRPSIFGKLNLKENQSNSPIPPVIEPANLAALAADLPPSALESQDNLMTKKKKQKQGSKASKKKKGKQKKKSLDFFGTSAFLKNQEDEEEAAPTTNTVNEKPLDASDNPNAVGGFGLTALWDDGSAAVDDYVANDDFHIPLPPPTSSSNTTLHGDLEAPGQPSSANHEKENTSIFDNFFGTTTTSTATTSALNTIQLSNEFLSNLSKKAVTSFFDNIETEIDLEEDPILKQVEWNKRNPHMMRSLQEEERKKDTFSYLNFFPTSSSSNNNTMTVMSSNNSSSSYVSSSSMMKDDEQTSSSSTSFTTSSTQPSLSSQYSSLLREGMSSFSGLFNEIKEAITPISSTNLQKTLLIVWKVMQFVLLLLYYISMMVLFIPLQGIIVHICGTRLFSFSSEELQSMRVRIRNRIREYCNANTILMGLTGVLFVVSYWKFQRYGTDAGD